MKQIYMHTKSLEELASSFNPLYENLRGYIAYQMFGPKVAPHPMEAQIESLSKLAVEKYGHNPEWLINRCLIGVIENLHRYDSARGNIKAWIANGIIPTLNRLMKYNKQEGETPEQKSITAYYKSVWQDEEDDSAPAKKLEEEERTMVDMYN